jgi:MarR family
MVDIPVLLKRVRRSGKGWTAQCPAHEDKQNSLSVRHRDGKWLLKCHAGCTWEEIIAAVGLSPGDLFDADGGRSAAYPKNNRATAQLSGFTLEQYAEAKALPISFLQGCGLSDAIFAGRPAVRIPYLGPGGEELAIRFRIARDGDRFRWKSGTNPCLYGLNRIADARTARHVVLVEGESDVHTLWQYDIPAVGLPGATNWREDRDHKWFDEIETIYVVVEPDKGGDSVRKWLAQSAIRTRAKLLQLPAKDPSAMHIADPNGFKEAWQVALLRAVPWTAMEGNERAAERATAWELCAGLAGTENILAEFDRAVGIIGLVGERRVAKLIYLAVTSRLLDCPVSIAVKGPSSGGKSFTVESVLRLFPDEAFYAVTAMSDRALAYSTEPLKHRHLVIYEAAGMASDFATYLIRSLLSEGRLRYETVEKTRDGLIPKLIEREGPTGLIVTTTSVRLHPENETRMLSLNVSDTREQTAAVFRALASSGTQNADVSQWKALQTWLANSMCEVGIPYAKALAELIPPLAVRLRRDFKTILTLIRAHALLHQTNRHKNASGCLIANVADYAAVRDLIAELVAESAEVAIKPEVRETVGAVAKLLADGREEITQAEIKKALKLDKSVVSRRVAEALDAGLLRNREDRKGRAARLVLGEPLPEAIDLLPRLERLHGCVGAEGDKPSSGNYGNGGYCAFCGKGEVVDDPLLTASTDGDLFLAHRTCLNREWPSTAAGCRSVRSGLD